MNRIKFAASNIWFLISAADVLPVRLVLALSAFLWTAWAYLIVFVDERSALYDQGRDLMFNIVPVWGWAVMFAIYGFLLLYQILLRTGNRILFAAVSAIGALLWSFNLTLLFVSRIEHGIMPMVAAQASFALVAWWLFLRDCNGN